MMQRSHSPFVPGRISPFVPEGWPERVRKHLEEVGRMANNMKLEEAIAHLDESLNDQGHDWGCEECKQEHIQLREWLVELKEMRAAEVKTVVRGKWKLLEGGAGRCSNCKSVLKDVWDYDGSDPFCSECGADMREVSTSEEPLNSEGTTRKEQEHNG